MKKISKVLFVSVLIMPALIMAQTTVSYKSATLYTSPQAALGIRALTVDSLGNAFYYKPSERRIEKYGTEGAVTEISGGGSKVIPDFFGLLTAPVVAAEYSSQMQQGNANLLSDSSGNLYFIMSGIIMRVNAADKTMSRIGGGGLLGKAFVNGGNAMETSITTTTQPRLALDPSGNLHFISLTSPPANAPFIVKLNANGTLTTIAGGKGRGFSGDDGPAVDAFLEFGGTGISDGGIAIDPFGNLFIAAKTRIRRVDSTGKIKTVAGNSSETGGTVGVSFTNASALESSLGSITYIAAGPDGSIFFVNGQKNVHQITPDEKINTIASEVSTASATGLAVDKAGNVYVTTGSSII